MEQEIKNIYKKMKYVTWKSMGVGAIMIITAIMVLSCFMGNPFPHNEVTANGTQWQDGWILEHASIWFLIAIMAVYTEWNWQVKYIKNLYRPITNLLEEGCDPVALRWNAYYGVNYGIHNKGSKTAIYFFEYHYMMALNALGEYEEAIRYLENEWISARQSRIRDRWIVIAKMNEAADKEHVGRYMMLLKELPPSMYRNLEVQAQIRILQRKYEEAIQLFDKMRNAKCFYQVSRHSGLAECYLKMGRYEEAKEHLDYVIQHGNRTLYKQKALRDLERIG